MNKFYLKNSFTFELAANKGFNIGKLVSAPFSPLVFSNNGRIINSLIYFDTCYICQKKNDGQPSWISFFPIKGEEWSLSHAFITFMTCSEQCNSLLHLRDPVTLEYNTDCFLDYLIPF